MNKHFFPSWAVAALFFLFLASSCGQLLKQEKHTTPINKETLYSDGIDKGIETIMKDLDVIGLGVAVVRGNEIIYKNSWGLKDRERNIPLSNDDLFRIASISKSFTATSILQLAEKGFIDLNADVSDLVGFKVRNPYFPEVVITPYMLLSHTSSLNDKQGYFSMDILNPATNPDWAKCYCEYRPGTRYRYCNMNYNTLGTILERVSRIRFDQYVVGNVLKPLGIDYGGYWVESLDSTKLVTLYEKDSTGTWQPQPEAYAPRREDIANYKMGYSAPIFSPTGGMKLNPEGLAKVMQMHMGLGTSPNGVKILSAESSLLMQSRFTEIPDTAPGLNPAFYGFALWNNRDLIEGKTMVGHTGGAWGALTLMTWNKERTWGVVVMTNGCIEQEGEEKEKGFQCVFYRVANCLYQNLIKGTEADI